MESNLKTANLFKRFWAVIIDFIAVLFLIYVVLAFLLKPLGGLSGAMGLNDFNFGEDLVKGAFAGLMAIFVLFMTAIKALHDVMVATIVIDGR